MIISKQTQSQTKYRKNCQAYTDKIFSVYQIPVNFDLIGGFGTAYLPLIGYSPLQDGSKCLVLMETVMQVGSDVVITCIVDQVIHIPDHVAWIRNGKVNMYFFNYYHLINILKINSSITSPACERLILHKYVTKLKKIQKIEFKRYTETLSKLLNKGVQSIYLEPADCRH